MQKEILRKAIARAEAAGMTNVAAMMRKYIGSEKVAETEPIKIKLASENLLEKTVVDSLFNKMAGASNDEIMSAMKKVAEELEKEDLKFSSDDEMTQFIETFTSDFVKNLK